MTDTVAKLAAPQTNNMRGALFMLTCTFFSAGANTCIKKIGAHLPAAEITFLRSFFGVLTIAPLIMKCGWGVFRTLRADLHLLRIVLFSFAVWLAIYGITHLPLTTAVSLLFTRPLFMIVIARIFLREEIHWRRGLATVLGFAGVLCIVGPTDVSSATAALAMLCSTALTACTMAMVRHQSVSDSPETITVWVTTGIAVTTALPAAFAWQMPDNTQWVLLMLLAVFGSVSNYLMIKAFTYGEATVVNPIDYSQIIITTIIGYALFSEVPTRGTLIGASLIIASTLYIVFREAALRRAAASRN